MRNIVLIGMALLLIVAVCTGCDNNSNGETQANNPSIMNNNARTPYENNIDTTSQSVSSDQKIVSTAVMSPTEALPAPADDTFGSPQSEYIKITSEDTVRMEPVYLDVRSEREYDSGHIPGAMLFYIADIFKKAEVVFPDKGQTIIVYCGNGVRSALAARLLIELGYNKVFDLGSIDDWTGEIIDSYGKISYNYFGALPDDIITPISYTTDYNIVSDNELIVRITLKGEIVQSFYRNLNNPTKYSSTTWPVNITTLTIKNLNTGFLQEFTDLETSNQFADEGNMYGLSFQDWNFDGYKDMSLWRYPGGTMGNNPTYYWLWDVDASMFMPCEELDEMSDFSTPTIIPETNQLYAYSRGDNEDHTELYYEWHSGQLVLVKSVYVRAFERTDEIPENLSLDDGSYILWRVVHELRDGEMALTEDNYSVWQYDEIVIKDDPFIKAMD